MNPAICQHFQKKAATRPRRLCHRCYNDFQIRDQYNLADGWVREAPEDVEPAQPRGNELPCLCSPYCQNYVKVNENMLSMVKALRMPWVLCPACKEKANEVED